jgi:hypothetical protein
VFPTTQGPNAGQPAQSKPSTPPVRTPAKKKGKNKLIVVGAIAIILIVVAASFMFVIPALSGNDASSSTSGADLNDVPDGQLRNGDYLVLSGIDVMNDQSVSETIRFTVSNYTAETLTWNVAITVGGQSEDYLFTATTSDAGQELVTFSTGSVVEFNGTAQLSTKYGVKATNYYDLTTIYSDAVDLHCWLSQIGNLPYKVASVDGAMNVQLSDTNIGWLR